MDFNKMLTVKEKFFIFLCALSSFLLMMLLLSSFHVFINKDFLILTSIILWTLILVGLYLCYNSITTRFSLAELEVYRFKLAAMLIIFGSLGGVILIYYTAIGLFYSFPQAPLSVITVTSFRSYFYWLGLAVQKA